LSTAIPTSRNPPVWVGESAAVQWVKTQLKEVAETELPVLVLGEPGVGRRLAGRTVHALSARRNQPFIQVNCAALHENLVPGELFGCEPEEFIESVSRQQGQLELADGGTIFLDEISTLPLGSQTRLLHALKDQRIQREGSKQTIPVDVRMIAATPQDLGKMARTGRFCAELFYRLGIVPVKIPPLRERRKDIPQLATHFVHQCAARMGQKTPGLSQETMTVLLAYDWPGNVWELKRVIERAVVLARGNQIRPEHIEQPFPAPVQGGRHGQQEAPSLLGLKPSRRTTGLAQREAEGDGGRR